MEFDWVITLWRSEFTDGTWRRTYSTVFTGSYEEAQREALGLKLYPDERFTVERR